ncbi:MAG: hypothetical protein P1V97_07680 [Planctomycetota bacterium]|nr:hypothetical protein [Planctomycetota bacterium]
MGRYELSQAKPWDLDFISEMGASGWDLAYPAPQWATQRELETMLLRFESKLEDCFQLILDVDNNAKVGTTAFLSHPGQKEAHFLIPRFHSELYVTQSDRIFTIEKAIDWARTETDLETLSVVLIDHQEELRDLLVERGFVVEARESVMLCQLDDFTPETKPKYTIQLIRPSHYEDGRSALRLLSGHFPGNYPQEKLEQNLARAWVVALAKEHKNDTQALGLIAWTTPEQQPYTDLILTRVDSSAKGRGVTSALLNHFLSHGKSLGRRYARASVDPNDGPGHWQLERAGFRDTQNIMRLRKSFKVESY